MKTKEIAGISLGTLAAAGAVAAALYFRNRQTIPAGVKAVHPFKLKKYLGKWYEIARLPMRFEKGLTHATAEYSLNEDGSVRVVNSGYSPKHDKRTQAVGKAKFVYGPDEAMLKVSFFGPFYSGYNVVEIDPEYKYSLVFGRNLDYLWLLSREKSMPLQVVKRYVERAESAGYDTSKLIWTPQE